MHTGGPGGGYDPQTRSGPHAGHRSAAATTTEEFFAVAAVAVETGVAIDVVGSTTVAHVTATVVAPDTAPPCTAPLLSGCDRASLPHCHPGVSYSGRE